MNSLLEGKTTGEIGEFYVATTLRNKGFTVLDMNKINKLSPFDLLINNKIRAEVKTAINVNKKWYFALTQKQSLGISDNNANYIKLNNGRYRKDFTKTCDVIILCGIAGSRIELFIMPPNAIPKNQTTISSSIKRGKWWMWHNRFDVITSQLKQA